MLRLSYEVSFKRDWGQTWKRPETDLREKDVSSKQVFITRKKKKVQTFAFPELLTVKQDEVF